MVSDIAFIFLIYIHWGKTFSLVPKSMSSGKVKVKYQGNKPRFRSHPFCMIYYLKCYVYCASSNYTNKICFIQISRSQFLKKKAVEHLVRNVMDKEVL